MGGTDARGATLSSAEVFDPATVTWAPCAPMKSGRAHHAAVVRNGRLVVLGGGNEREIHQESGEIYDPDTDTWTPAQAPNVHRWYFTAVSM